MARINESLLSFFLKNFPDFRQQWESEENYNISENGFFDLSGLCAEFSIFYIKNFHCISNLMKKNLFNEIESILSLEEKDINNKLSASIKSCFIENIACTEVGEKSKLFMGVETRKIFDQWHFFK